MISTICPTCGQDREPPATCTSCGVSVAGADDAVAVAVGHPDDVAPKVALLYCRGCAVEQLPAAAMGRGPGSDLPASLDPPEVTT